MTMITYTTPEKAGVDPKYIRRFLAKMEEQRINLHDVIMMRGNEIFFEKYWAPFTPERPHRMYSVTKSFVSVAIGFLLQEGKLSLDDPITKYFPDKIGPDTDPLLMTQTIRDMLRMSTCFVGFNWFLPEVDDRLKYYFSHKADKIPGTLFDYDSTGSYVLSCLVERLSGKPFLDYLKEKLLDRLGSFEDAEVLLVSDGTPWGDSGLLCRPRGLLAFARFVMNGGVWDGEQLLDRAYLQAATSFQTDCNMTDAVSFNTWGYGYQFWMTEQGGFSMNGMGGQYAVCCPDKDLILVFNGDDQLSSAQDTPCVFRAFYDLIVAHLDGAVPEEKEIPLDAPLKLSTARGEAASPFEKEINGRTYLCHENPMGIKWFRLDFNEDGGAFVYENAQGEKVLEFGRKENRFGKFPEYGYSDRFGNLHQMTDFRYDAAVSAGWIEEKKLQLRVQVIDRYFGLLVITIGFKDPGRVSICMKKAAEDFFDTYEGWLYAFAQDISQNLHN